MNKNNDNKIRLTFHPAEFGAKMPIPLAEQSVKARFSTSVTPDGTHTLIRGLLPKKLLPTAFWIKYFNIFSVVL